MNLEQKINYHLNKYPVIKKVMKNVYQHMMYMISPKIKSEGNIIRVSPNDPKHEYFFGYYDKSPWDANDRYMLCVKAKDTWSDVSPREKADILLIDTTKKEEDSNRVKKIAETRAWNVQQSCMLQWLGPDYCTKILYNDFRNGAFCSVILELASMKETVIPAPVYAVAEDGKNALTLDFARLYSLRPGYGYYNIPETTKGIPLPDENCIWKIDLSTGEVKPILKYTDFATFQPRPEMMEKGTVHKVNHLMISPGGKRFMVLHRWFTHGRKYTRLITSNMDGTDMYVLSDDDMVSHCFWKNEDYIIAFENKKKGGTGYYLMKDKTQQFYHCWPELVGDGHPSYSPDGSLIVTDTYPNRARMSSIMIMNGDVRQKEINVVARVFSPFKYDNDTRCDLHPRWNHEGNKVCFDACFEGRRGMYVVEVEKPSTYLVNENKKFPIKVLYISDNLFQRFGVTAVMMNYFRNIDKNRVNIDFLVWEGNDESIENEIKASGASIFYMPKLGIRNYKSVTSFLEKFFEDHCGEYAIVHSHFCQMDAIIFPIAKKYGVQHCISHSHNTKFSDYKIRAIRNRIMCIPIKKVADTWAACSIKAGRALYGKNFINSEKKLIITNAVDCDKYSYKPDIRNKLRKQMGLSNKVVIGNVGSLKPQKNQKYLLEIFAQLLKISTDKEKYRLLIVGDGNLKEELVNYASKLNISKYVSFLGQRNDVEQLLQVMDIFVLPSLYEGLPVIGIEAQAAGLPCLFSDEITKEVDICNTTFISLNEKSEWINSILDTVDFARKDTTLQVERKGYNIANEAEKLIDFYEKYGMREK